MKKVLLVLLFLFITNIAQAQTNQCSTAAGTGTVSNPSDIYFVQSDFNTNDPTGQPLVTGFIVQVLSGTTVVSTANVSKAAALLQPGTPANCYKIAIPSFNSNVQQNTSYKIGLIADNPTIPSMVGVSSQSFFLRGAPSAPASLKLVIIEWLEKLSAQVRSSLKRLATY